MTTWALVLVIGHGVTAVNGFKSETSCVEAGKELKARIGQWERFEYKCIEVK